MTEKDGYYYGRGTIDMKDGIVAITQAMIDLEEGGLQAEARHRRAVHRRRGDQRDRRQEWRDRSGSSCSAIRNSVSTRMAAAAGSIRTGRLPGYTMQTAEKTFAGYTLTVRNRGGHSSKPRKDNAIYSLAHALDKLEAYRFHADDERDDARLFRGPRRSTEKGPLGDAMRRWLANPNDGEAADIIEASESEVGLTRTRCVATRLFAGHADNALPQLATAMINCRIFPGVDPNAIKRRARAAGRRPRGRGDAQRRLCRRRLLRRCGPT